LGGRSAGGGGFSGKGFYRGGREEGEVGVRREVVVKPEHGYRKKGAPSRRSLPLGKEGKVFQQSGVEWGRSRERNWWILFLRSGGEEEISYFPKYGRKRR